MTKRIFLFFVTFIWFPLTQADVVLYDGEGSPEALGYFTYHQFPFPPTFFPPSLSSLTVPFAEGMNTPSLKTDLGLGNVGYVGYSNYKYTFSPEQLQAINLAQPKETLSLGTLELVNNQFPILDRSLGFEMTFNLAVTYETSEAKQAGFHIVVIDNNGNGVILGFRNQQLSDNKTSQYIFAQSEQFEEAEGKAFDVSKPTDYILSFSGGKNSYYLFANGKKLLIGKVRTYQFDPSKSSLPFNPYAEPNFIFFGDYSDQGQSHFTLGKIGVRQYLPQIGEGKGYAVNAMGSKVETTSKFRGGISINGSPPTALRLKPKVSDQVDVAGEVTVGPEHVGKNANFIVYAAYKVSPLFPSGYQSFYMLDHTNNVSIWDKNPQSLVAFKESVTLQEKHFLPMYRGQFVLPGYLCIYFGYRLQEEGTVVTNEECIEVTIQE